MAAQGRPPVVTIMGHVDHGKTSLLDAIRKTSVAAKESGGITQHIGAYTVTKQGKAITFLDTPGHAAFASMRSRGAQATDIVVLVVSATEGVKPQTIESIQHIKKAGVQYLVALTKIDLPEANIEKVKTQLTEHEVFVEGYGGDIVVVPVSAKTGEGLDKLLEMILLIAELQELKGDPSAPVEGVVIESRRDAGKGPVASVLVHNGTLRVGDTIFAEMVECKVKALFDENGKPLKEVGPAYPAEVMGWHEVPVVGSKITLIKGTKPDLPKAEEDQPAVATTDAVKLKLILKSDVAGTLEAIQQSLGDTVEVIATGVGDINDADLQLAEATKSIILGFRVKAPGAIKKQAELTQVKIILYTVIYDLLEDIEKQVHRLIEPTMDEEELGAADVVAVFDIREERIAGCKVKTGEITKGQLYHVKRGDVTIADPKLKSIKRGKDDIESAKAGTECGILFRGFDDVQISDMITMYRIKSE